MPDPQPVTQTQAGPRAVIVVSGAPELRRVPQHFWRRFAKFLRDGSTGQFTFNTNRGKVSSYDAREHGRADDDEVESGR